jgi:hypothetical protein
MKFFKRNPLVVAYLVALLLIGPLIFITWLIGVLEGG